MHASWLMTVFTVNLGIILVALAVVIPGYMDIQDQVEREGFFPKDPGGSVKGSDM